MTTSVFKLAIWTEPGDDDGPDDWPDDGPGAGALGSSTGTFGKTMSSACSCPWPAGASCLRLSGRTSILIFFAGFSSGGLFKLKKSIKQSQKAQNSAYDFSSPACIQLGTCKHVTIKKKTKYLKKNLLEDGWRRIKYDTARWIRDAERWWAMKRSSLFCSKCRNEKLSWGPVTHAKVSEPL